MALAQNLMLPGDMQKKMATALDRMISTEMVSGIKVTYSFIMIFNFVISLCKRLSCRSVIN